MSVWPKKVLAREVVSLVHGKAAYEQAVKTSEILFGGGDLRQLDAKSILTGLKAAPQHQVTDDEDLTLVELLISAGIAPSKDKLVKILQMVRFISMVNVFKHLIMLLQIQIKLKIV